MSCPYQTPTLTPSPALTVLSIAASPDAAALQSFYKELNQRSSLQFDASSNCWLAAGSALAQAALQHPDLAVRPPDQAVPTGLQGRPFGTVFARWLRMRDDAPREAEKQALQSALASIDPATLQQVAARQADLALQAGWSHWQWASIPCTVAHLLGLKMLEVADQQTLLTQLAAMALALKPQAELTALNGGDRAVTELMAALDLAPDAPLRQALRTQAGLLGPGNSTDGWQAQALALLWQGYEAGAGLLGQALLAPHHSSASAPADLAGCAALLDEIGRQPGVIHHTRRWALRDCELAGQALRKGDAVLVILAGGVASQAEPLGFGSGRHRCPGIALTRNAGAMALWRATQQVTLQQSPRCTGFQALANARIPIFDSAMLNNKHPELNAS
ncbi:hypothetical protein LNV09_23505 [Paucibacter sp. B2R-40]|uniref:hypothetical protein n=1 Tax=Paucibacter sp. B2R-40 TaxID=2893554 RepID=UPI0021E45D56|nr:hypothetical protein [Paucibacter sp. B2R-40]MCV2357122.1 hypothetical protein [Paucibacter sp. B2R-40]